MPFFDESQASCLAYPAFDQNLQFQDCNFVTSNLVILLFQDSRKIFHSLVSLVIHHSVMPESLPCPLVLSCDFGDFGSNPGFSNQKLWHSYPQPPTNNRDHDFADTDLADYSSLVMTLRKSISSSTSDISLTSSLPD